MEKEKMHMYFLVILLVFRRVFAHPDPLLAWPLSPSNPAMEIVSPGKSHIGTSGCFSEVPGHPFLNYTGLKMSGSVNSYMEFTINTTIVIDDFSFMLFVLTEGGSGTLFQYKKVEMETGSGEIKMITLFYNDSTLYLEVFGDNFTDKVLALSLVTYIRSKEWTPIIVSYDQGTEEFEIFAGNVSTKGNCIIEKPFLGLPGKLKVGGAFAPENNAYLGRMTCLQFYDARTADNDFENGLTLCMTSLWPPSAPVGNSLPTCDSKKGFYKLISRGTPPDSTAQVANLNSTTKIKCAQFCSIPSNGCVSFAINKLENTCKLYDVDASPYLIGDKNVLYYVSDTLIGCC